MALYNKFNFWKDPRLDDEGTYDYLVEELPQNSHTWNHDRYRCKCDECGKERSIYVRDIGYFYCWDGWDSMDYTTCWKCVLKHKLHTLPKKTKNDLLIVRPLKLAYRYRIVKKLGLDPKKYMTKKYMSKDYDSLWAIFEKEI